MNAFARNLRHLIRDEEGATAIEYGLIAAFMGACLIPVMAAFSTDLASLYNQIPGFFALF